MTINAGTTANNVPPALITPAAGSAPSPPAANNNNQEGGGGGSNGAAPGAVPTAEALAGACIGNVFFNTNALSYYVFCLNCIFSECP